MRKFAHGMLVAAVAMVPVGIRAQVCGSGFAGSSPAHGPANRFAFVDTYLGEFLPGYYEIIWFIAAGTEGGPYAAEISGGGLVVDSPAWSPDGARIAFSWASIGGIGV